MQATIPVIRKSLPLALQLRQLHSLATGYLFGVPSICPREFFSSLQRDQKTNYTLRD